MVTLDKAQRLLYGDSLMTHAMVFTGLSWEVGWKEKYKHEFLVYDSKLKFSYKGWLLTVAILWAWIGIILL